jgi:DNA-binding NarL/FixJ family response regulator
MSENNKVLAIVDDHPIVIEGLKYLLKTESPYTAVLSFTNAESFLSFIAHNRVDIVLLDMMLPDGNGVDLCKAIKMRYPDACVLGMSNLAEQSTVLNLLQNGASGYILKSSPAAEILAGITSALRGETVMSNEIRELMIDALVKGVKTLPALTKREKQLLQLLAEGKTTAVIAKELFLSRFTVDTYRKNLLQKFSVKNTTELLMLMIQEKLL